MVVPPAISRNSGMSASAVRPARSTSGAPSSPGVFSNDDKLGAEGFSPEIAARALTGFNGNRRVPPPVNEPIKTYVPGSPERAELKARLQTMSNERVDIPLIIGGNEVHTGALAESVMPHNHRHVLANWHRASPEPVDQAVKAAQNAAKDWAKWALQGGAAV